MAAPFKIAYFVTPHGFGHAARAAAVMLALRRRLPAVTFDLFTRVPQWFFRDSLGEGFTYHTFDSDVGLVQTTPFSEDLPATVAALDVAAKTAHSQVLEAAKMLKRSGCRLVISDIAPLGILAAQAAGLPAVLVENFTWDFIYAGYDGAEPGFGPHIERLGRIYAGVDLHFQTIPICRVHPAAIAVNPVARPPLTGRDTVRARLGLGTNQKAILVTLGGIEGRFDALAGLKQHASCIFIIPGAAERMIRTDNLLLLPHHSDFYHPDLMAACDAVIGKLGYSTVAEAYHAGVPYACIPRPNFPETPSMAQFAQQEMGALELPHGQFLSGRWGDLPERLVSAPRVERAAVNGAQQIVDHLLERYG